MTNVAKISDHTKLEDFQLIFSDASRQIYIGEFLGRSYTVSYVTAFNTGPEVVVCELETGATDIFYREITPDNALQHSKFNKEYLDINLSTQTDFDTRKIIDQLVKDGWQIMEGPTSEYDKSSNKVTHYKLRRRKRTPTKHWQNNTAYGTGEIIWGGYGGFVCILAHVSDESRQPVKGRSDNEAWKKYWEEIDSL